jgi:Protein of unknown function (DUF4199)
MIYMNKLMLKYSIIVGVLVLIYTCIVFFYLGDVSRWSIAEVNKVEMLGLLRYAFVVVGMLTGVRILASQSENFGYTQAVSAGIVIAVVAGVFIGVSEMIYILQHPNYYEIYGNIHLQTMQAQHAKPADIALFKQHLADYQFMANPWTSGVWYFMETCIVGALASLIMGIFLRKN